MPDFADQAQEEYETMFRHTIAERIRRLTEAPPVSATYCYDCGEAIPERRRQAVPGCQRCITCQEQID